MEQVKDEAEQEIDREIIDLRVWGRRFIIAVCVILVSLQIIIFSIYYSVPTGKDQLVLSWAFKSANYSNNATIYAMMTSAGTVEYLWYTLPYLTFTYIVVLYIFVFGMSPSNVLVYKTETGRDDRWTDMLAKYAATTNMVHSYTSKNHEHGGYYSFVYLYLLRLVTYSCLGLSTVYLTGNNT
jgi:hypothetical protein